MIILWLLLSVAFFSVGEYYSKVRALEPAWAPMFVLVAAYVLGALAWLPAIYKGQVISVIGTLWSLLSVMASLLVGGVFFNEHLTPAQKAGAGSGIRRFVGVILYKSNGATFFA